MTDLRAEVEKLAREFASYYQFKTHGGRYLGLEEVTCVLRDLIVSWAEPREAEVQRLREKNTLLNRRCQLAEAGVAAKVQTSRGSMGKMLALASASMEQRRAEAAAAEVQRLREELSSLKTRPACCEGGYEGCIHG